MSNKVFSIGIVSSACSESFMQMFEANIAECADKPNVIKSNIEWPEVENKDNKFIVSSDRKLQVFEEVDQLIKQGADVIAFPCLCALSWLEELQTEVQTPIANMGKAIAKSLATTENARLGYLGIPETAKQKALVENVKLDNVSWIYLSEQAHLIEEFKTLACAQKKTEALEKLAEACRVLVNRGATAIVPSCCCMATFAKELQEQGMPVLDLAAIYAQYLVQTEWKPLAKPFKLGLVGGLGPAATVDLYDKFTKATPALNDQEHFKVVIEQNPQVPDRTKCLLDGGVDPTLALFAACRKLEADGVDAILIPCNTAHAFFEAIAPRLRAPIINMQRVTLEDIQEKHGKDCVIGLLATTGTCRTGIYGKKAEEMNLKMVTPDEQYQKLVMSAIYGPKGVKAGFNTGVCREELLEAARHLVRDKGANVLILGCTELPLILDESEAMDIGEGLTAAVVDPSATLARRAVKVATEITKIRGRL